MNPMINMTTHLLMLIFSRSCVKKNNNNRKDTVLLERPINHTCSVGLGWGGGVLGLIFAGYVLLAS